MSRPYRPGTLPFANSASLYREMGIGAPAILGRSARSRGGGARGSRGTILLQKVALRSDPHAAALYAEATEILARIQHRGALLRRGAEAGGFRAFSMRLDSGALPRELRFFVEHFLEGHLGVRLGEAAACQLDGLLDDLSAAAAAGPEALCHRDYHSRNLIALPPAAGSDGLLRVIDHQDTRLGPRGYDPRGYDLMSLARDPYVATAPPPGSEGVPPARLSLPFAEAELVARFSEGRRAPGKARRNSPTSSTRWRCSASSRRSALTDSRCRAAGTRCTAASSRHRWRWCGTTSTAIGPTRAAAVSARVLSGLMDSSADRLRESAAFCVRVRRPHSPAAPPPAGFAPAPAPRPLPPRPGAAGLAPGGRARRNSRCAPSGRPIHAPPKPEPPIRTRPSWTGRRPPTLAALGGPGAGGRRARRRESRCGCGAGFRGPPVERQAALPGFPGRVRVRPGGGGEGGGPGRGLRGGPLLSPRERRRGRGRGVRRTARPRAGSNCAPAGFSVVHAAEPYPITPKEHGASFLLDHRHLWLRSKKQHALLRIRDEVLHAFREYLRAQEFVCADTPIFTPNACEGDHHPVRDPVLRPARLSEPERPALQRGGGDVGGTDLLPRPHLPRRKIEDAPPSDRVLDARTRSGVRRTRGHHRAGGGPDLPRRGPGDREPGG